MRDSGIPAPRASLVWVTLNGEALGLYFLVEQDDKRFLADRFRDDQGNIPESGLHRTAGLWSFLEVRDSFLRERLGQQIP